MRCDQCKYWDTEEIQPEWDADAIGFHKCKAVKERWDIQDSASEGMDWDASNEDGTWMKVRNDALKASRAYVQDGSQYHADLVTGPDFFCALFSDR